MPIKNASLFERLLLKRLFLLPILFLNTLAISGCAVTPQSDIAFDSTKIENSISAAMEAFNTPGLSIAVVRDGQFVHLSGHGKKDLDANTSVTPNTYFRLASLSKAFTAASVAILVEDGKLSWDDKVVDHLPDFKMADPYVTKEMTIRDLLTHRSGLGSAMGDSMLWPEPSGFSRQEIVHNLRYFHPQHGFRNQYAYSNVMYIVAAEIVSKVAGKPWEEFVDSAIFKPLEMDCYAGDVPKDKVIDSAIPYGYSEERGLFAIPRNSISQIGLASAPAGGIVCNAESMAKWLIHLLEISQPNFEDTKTTIAPIFSNKQLQQMWHPITPLTVSRLEREWNDTVLKAYGLGWRIANFYGHRLISHTGTLSGFQTNIALLPEKNLGVVLLNNGSNYGARSAVMQTVLRQFVPEALQQNWVDAYKEYQNEREAIYLANFVEPTGNGNVNLQPGDYTGKFVDQWFGKLTVEKKEDVLTVLSSRMPTLKGKLEPFEGDTWVIRWLNQNAARDAFIRFELDSENSVTSFTLYPYTTRDVKNHEWRDMHFIKQLD